MRPARALSAQECETFPAGSEPACLVSYEPVDAIELAEYLEELEQYATEAWVCLQPLDR